MKNEIISCDLLIIGAGLTGLTLAYLLKDLNIDIKIVEARKRIGGRILSEDYHNNQPLELGATWLGNKHTHLNKLLKDLNIETFEQVIGSNVIYEAISTSPPYLANLPPNPEPSLRIKGGTYHIIHTLAHKIQPSRIKLGNPVQSIQNTSTSMIVTAQQNTYNAKLVVSTLPPHLLVSTIQFESQLPEALIQTANKTHTWMGESIKIALTFEKPFWRSEHLSGTIMSNVGPISEMYEHSNYEDNFHAIKGFLNGGYAHLHKEERLAIVLKQLKKYYSNHIESYVSYAEKVWKNDTYTYIPYSSNILPHQNNGHTLFKNSIYENKFLIAGSETSLSFPGYMEGAVASAIATEKWIKKSYNK